MPPAGHPRHCLLCVISPALPGAGSDSPGGSLAAEGELWVLVPLEGRGESGYKQP